MLKKLGAAVTSKPTLPAHSSIRIRSSSPGSITFYVCSPLITVEGHLSCDVGEQIDLGTHAELFGKVVQALPKDAPVEFTMTPTSLSLETSKSSFKVKTFSDAIFMPMRDYSNMPFTEIDFKAFIASLKRVAFCCDPEATRDEYKAVCINSDHFVATDGFCISVYPNRVLKIPGEILIPGRAVAVLQKLYDKSLGKGRLYCTDSELNLACDGIFSSTRRQAGKFVGYHRVLPEGPCTKITVDRVELVDAIDRVLIMSPPEGMKNVFIQLDVNSITMHANNGKHGEAKETVSVGCDTRCEEICLSGKSLLDILKNYETDKLTLEYRGPEKAFVITDKDHINVIQPVRRTVPRAAAGDR